MIKSFEEYINEDYNYTIKGGNIVLEDRWFYYDQDDEIIYGSDEMPVNPDVLFYFSPKSCEVYFGKEKQEYDVNNPILLISYELDSDEFKMYAGDDVFNRLEELGLQVNYNMRSLMGMGKTCDKFEELEDRYKLLLIYGNELLASTFDIIEEN